MKIPSLFKKKDSEQEEIDKIIQENVTGEEAGLVEQTPEEQTPETFNQPEEMKKMRMNIDKLVAEFEVIRQVNHVNEERFQRVSEEIGELRRAGVEREKDINKIMIKAEKASQLVEQVQPQNLMIAVEKVDAKTQAVEAKEKADKSLIDYMAKEIKDLRSIMETFRGLDSLITLNEEVKSELMNIKKVEASVSKHADKVENIFVKTQKSFNNFMKLSQDFKSLETRFEALMKESENFKASLDTVAKKEDLNKLQKDFEEKLGLAEKTKPDLEKKRKEMDEAIPEIRELLKESKKLEDTLQKRVTEVDDSLSELSRMDQKKYVTEERFNQELGDFFKSVLEKIEALDRKIK